MGLLSVSDHSTVAGAQTQSHLRHSLGAVFTLGHAAKSQLARAAVPPTAGHAALLLSEALQPAGPTPMQEGLPFFCPGQLPTPSQISLRSC